MFDFYNPEAYTKAQPESFQAFRANKERLFKILPWIEIYNRNIYVLEGPGYWVTWTDQFYRAPNLTTEGVRRLYWKRDDQGEFRVVGMDWEPRNLGMRADFLKGALASAPESALSDAALPSNFSEARPRPVDVSEATQVTPEVAVTEAPAIQRAASPPDSEVTLLLQRQMDEWLQAFKERSPVFFTFYSPDVYGRQFGEKQSFRAFKAEQERLFRNSPWLHVQARPVIVEKQGDHWVTSCALLIRDPLRSEEGIRRLYWQQNLEGQFRIVGSSWTLQPELAMQADYLESVTPQVSAMIEAWRQAWESAEIDEYAEFYLPRARQGTRSGPSIFQHKYMIWSRSIPKKVELSGMRIQLDKGGLRVDMAQNYQDTNGYQDRGIKTLILTPQGETWRIAVEDWAPQPSPQS